MDPVTVQVGLVAIAHAVVFGVWVGRLSMQVKLLAERVDRLAERIEDAA